MTQTELLARRINRTINFLCLAVAVFFAFGLTFSLVAALRG